MRGPEMELRNEREHTLLFWDLSGFALKGRPWWLAVVQGPWLPALQPELHSPMRTGTNSDCFCITLSGVLSSIY